MKFKYCIINFYDNDARGTDNKETADEFSMAEEYIVIDLTTGQLIVAGNSEDMKQLEIETTSDPETEDIEEV